MKRVLASWLGPWFLVAACGGRADPHSGPAATAGSAVGGTSAGSSVGTSGDAGAAADAGRGGVPTTGGTSAGSAGVTMGGAGTGAVTYEPWPGTDDVQTVDAAELFTDNVSGITYEPAAAPSPPVLWAVANIPGQLYRLLPTAGTFARNPDNGWAQGKLLRFPDGTGAADAESVALGGTASDGLYVASEHDNAAASVSRCSVLRYDVLAPGASLTATHEWNLTALLPPFGANLGIEALTWVPDTYLVEKGFFDEDAEQPYDSALYGQHGAGLFFVGVEQTGQIYGFVLEQGDGSATLVARISSPFPGVMSLEHDRETGYLWFGCDDTCANRYGVLDIDTTPGSASLGLFTLRALFDRPASLPNSNHEGIALGPESECAQGLKPFYWADDADVEGHTLRRGSIPCGPFL